MSNILGLNVGSTINGGISAVGNVLQTGLNAAAQAFVANGQLQVAQLNLQASQAQAAAQTQAQSQTTAQTRLLVTGGLVLAAAVVAIRFLRN